MKKHYNDPTQRKILYLNIGIFVVVYALFMLQSMKNITPIEIQPECIVDKPQIWTKDITKFLSENIWVRNILMISASLMMDTIFFALGYHSCLQNKTFKLLITVFLFYAFRAWLQSIFFMRMPDDYLWSYPGFFSISVEYFPKNDFFYSGHIGILMVEYLFFREEKARKLQYFTLFAIFWNFFVLLVTRAHYSIDLIIGLLVGHYLYIIAGYIKDHFGWKEGLENYEIKDDDNKVK